ncbi:uncharacterized protein LOC104415241 [Eucalyptus grandis]|uniref:Uncharacterized protein n=5 Tax=Eucalyptus TaxID=3932 RepID=A0A059B505_EUCGR|nr:uncharacterized protein LOC104415241 [Eucalyptus grandis]KAK3418088.1 hypothetical protein EUGRSUZ_H04058 [Eucalyptus grandis]KAK3418089.1 hypothetical protein EUGRSUZ_H04058 [Eucalyptus grandis]KAK3418090.1 hypothetical protein EUGRSUZ_H04058 [Eucalyptus grandis]
MKVIFALFIVLMLTTAALQADAERQLSDASMGRKASAGVSDATVSTDSAATTAATSSKTTRSLSDTSASTPAAADATSDADAENGPLKHEKNDGYGSYSSAPASTNPDNSHHEIRAGPIEV